MEFQIIEFRVQPEPDFGLFLNFLSESDSLSGRSDLFEEWVLCPAAAVEIDLIVELLSHCRV